jgi:glycosyltransferase involved in cell wall biosynthesis
MSGDSNPLVSVIIPVYNGTNYLREAIDSVLTQTYKNYEIIVVDDGSTDGTWDIIQSYGTRVYGIHKENGGVASALNCGIREARGDYIAWLSHDDLFLPEKLEKQVRFLQKFKQFKACYTDYYITGPDGKILSEVLTPWYPQIDAIRVLFGDMYISGSTILIERKCFDEIGVFSEALRYTQDAEMWLRLIRQFGIGRLPEILMKQRSHPGQGSVGLKPAQREEIISLYQHLFYDLGIAVIFPEYAERAKDPEIEARACVWFGDTMAFHRGFYALADEFYKKSADLWPAWTNPGKLKHMLGSRIVVFPRRLFYYFLWRIFKFRFPTIAFPSI